MAPFAEPAGDRVHVNFTRTDQERLNVQLKRMYDREFNEGSADFEEGISFEDRKATEMVILMNGYYQLTLPFRQETLDLPNSLPTAERRLTCLKGKMER